MEVENMQLRQKLTLKEALLMHGEELMQKLKLKMKLKFELGLKLKLKLKFTFFGHHTER